ncbi:hypothetical protein SISSUDRAFT_1041476 [Sistotremastrum suecicum HHB10207 ss-3]|uniref:Vps53 N-terminal domain-containing protein n=1 Tax=Sistotremastrum suecicum HHB10207 ss-3 TaxID=1314776 RepID=A0A166HAL5_9AGAM|nr:hypothetical protein SISSUDRAFT_1041476 [Sistotremastrum suecicum HHB10207 ss-3]
MQQTGRRNAELPREVVVSIQRILDIQPSEPLDALTNFKPIETINTLFPNETALQDVQSVQTRLEQEQQELQAQISALLTELKENQDRNRMHAIQEMIGDLLSQMNKIREKATESEVIVRNITQDIQKLDMAKRNLIQSMTTLKRFQMLANALSQLEELVKQKNYADAAPTLQAVKEFSTFFKAYKAIERVAVVWRRVQEQQALLRAKIEEDFDNFLFQDPAKPVKASTIKDGCLVLDILGEDVRQSLIDKYCSIELKEYRRIFRPTDEAGQLDNISRRFAWFRRILTMHEQEHERAFPPSWNVGRHLCARFAEITRDDLSGALSRAAPTLTVSLLLESLQYTMEFETQMGKKYDISFSELLRSCSRGVHAAKSISSAFEPHMGVYIDAQDKALSDMLGPHRGQKARSSLDSVGSSDGTASVLPSSTELFFFYAKNLEQCSKLTTESPMLDLSNLYRKWLRLYAEDVLAASMKRVEKERRSLEQQAESHDLLNACTLINTADYCQATALELEEKIKEKIAERFQEKVSFQAERDMFVSVISSAILLLLRELESACEASFTTMIRTQWSNIQDVTGPSAYVDTLVAAIEKVATVVSENLQQKKYLRNFHDKVVSLVLVRFTNAVVKARPLQELSAEQLLIDLQEIKSCLLKLPGSPTSESAAGSSFAKNITKATSQLETLLKVVNAPIDPANEFITNYMVLIGDASFSNFQKILDLKGTPRSSQNNLLDTFLTMTSVRPELKDASFLSSLDMEPSTAQITTVSPTGSKVSLPSLLAGGGALGESKINAGGLLGLGPPPTSRSDTPTSARSDDAQRKGGFGDLRRFVSFGVRRDTMPQN